MSKVLEIVKLVAKTVFWPDFFTTWLKSGVWWKTVVAILSILLLYSTITVLAIGIPYEYIRGDWTGYLSEGSCKRIKQSSIPVMVYMEDEVTFKEDVASSIAWFNGYHKGLMEQTGQRELADVTVELKVVEDSNRSRDRIGINMEDCSLSSCVVQIEPNTLPENRKTALRHELGHCLGLGHVVVPGCFMCATFSTAGSMCNRSLKALKSLYTRDTPSLPLLPLSNYQPEIGLGSRQAVRHETLDLAFAGSNPASPAIPCLPPR